MLRHNELGLAFEIVIADLKACGAAISRENWALIDQLGSAMKRDVREWEDLRVS
jgi:hypothetical protein